MNLDDFISYLPDFAFVRPYLEREFETELSDKNNVQFKSVVNIFISSTCVYAPTAGEILDESSPTIPNHPAVEAENIFIQKSNKQGVKPIIIRCANVVGTGMTGYPRVLAEEIYRARFFHFLNNDARISCVHASDVARIIHIIASNISELSSEDVLIFNLTDGDNPTIHDFAEAIAFRLNNKRISTLSTKPQQLIGKLLYGRKKYLKYTSTLTFSACRIFEFLSQLSGNQFKPTPVVEYLRTHNYDENSL